MMTWHNFYSGMADRMREQEFFQDQKEYNEAQTRWGTKNLAAWQVIEDARIMRINENMRRQRADRLFVSAKAT